MSQQEAAMLERTRRNTTPKWLGKLDKIICWLGRAIVASSLLIVLIFSFLQVLDRYLFKGQFSAWDQIARIAMVWAAFIGAAMALRERRNLVIEVLDSSLSPAVARFRETAFNLILLVAAAVLFIKSIPVVGVGMWQSIVGTPFTYAVSYVALSVSLALFGFFLILRLVFPGACVPIDLFVSSDEDLS